MDSNENGRYQVPAISRSPLLHRSSSVTPNHSNNSASSRHETSVVPTSRSHNLVVSRSKSTSRARTNHVGDDMISSGRHSVSYNSREFSGPAKLVADTVKVKRLARSATSSPSAWALSPGRLSSPVVPMCSSNKVDKLVRDSSGVATAGTKVKSLSSGGVAGVLRFFRSKKVSSVQEEAFHRYRVSHARLVQWRFVNARTEVAMAARNSVAKEKVFDVWIRNFHLRNSVVDKRIRVQKIKQESKMLHIISDEIHLLDECAKIEKRNTEAVGKLSKSLSALATRLPLTHSAKGNAISVYQAMRAAMEAMEAIETTISMFYSQLERTVPLLKELARTLAQEEEGLVELGKTTTSVAALQLHEQSLQAFLIQSA